MFVLTRRKGERLHIGGGIVLTVLETQGGKVRLGVEAPRGVAVWRHEIWRPGKPAKPGAREVEP